METIIENSIKNSMSGVLNGGGDTVGGQPWYWRWGVAALGSLGGVLLAFAALKSFLTLGLVEGLLEAVFASILISFEATALAKGFNFTACQTLVGFADKLAPLMRTVIYSGLSILLVIFSDSMIGTVFMCIPALICAALYFLLFLDQRGDNSEQAPVMENEVNEFA
jgi:hypothetical protein